MITRLDLNSIKDAVLPLLEDCNAYLREQFSSGIKISLKKGSQFSTSAVTEADEYIENFLYTRLSEVFSDIGFIGEENTQNVKNEYNWIIDPIDGTGNFATGIPLFAVSIALYHQNSPVAAFISFPALHEVIYGTKGGGVFFNGEKISRVEPKFPKPIALYSHIGSSKEKFSVIQKVIEYINVPKYYGCTVYSGVAVVLGKAHSLIAINNALWDIAGIFLLFEELGYATKFISEKPNIQNKSDLVEYKFSVIFGDEEVVTKLFKLLKE